MSFANRKDIKDNVTDAWRSISVDHNAIHEGESFSYPIITDIASAGTYVIGFKTPASTEGYVHYRNEKVASSGEKISIALQKAATISGGTTVSSINSNEVSSNTSGVIFKTGVTLATAGTTVSIGYIGGGTGVGGNRSGSETSQENERVLAANTQYAIVVANGGAGTATVVITPRWYEEELAQ